MAASRGRRLSDTTRRRRTAAVNVNLEKALVENVDAEILDAERRAASALASYVSARQEKTRLEAIRDVQQAMSKA